MTNSTNEIDANCTLCINVHEKAKLDGGGFECRFEPPKVIVLHQQQGIQVVSMFPPVNEKMSCAMFEANIDLPDNVVRIGH